MTLRNAHNIHRSILSHLLDKPVSVSVKQAATDVEHYITTSRSMMLVQLCVMSFVVLRVWCLCYDYY